MSKRSQEKRKARSKEKKLAQRRFLGSSPLTRLAGTAEETCECWLNCSPDQRMISLSVLRPVRGGQMVGAFFLIDRDCVGLKDAFYRLDVDPVELRAGLRRRSEDLDMCVIQIKLVDVRKAVAEALRWTRAHPFRVPPDAERCIKILGGIGDIDNADISAFGDENGDMFYVGRQIDLVKCLKDITLEEFLERDDVVYTFHLGNETFGEPGDWDEGQDEPLVDEDEIDDLDPVVENDDLLALRERLKHNLMDAVRRWCFAQAVAPHPALEAAVDIMVESSMEGLAAENEEAGAQRALRAEETLRSLEDAQQLAAIGEAQGQLAQFLKSFPSEEAVLRAMSGENEEM